MKIRIKQLRSSLLRIAAALAVVLGIPALLYCLWSPGADVPYIFDRGENGIWLGHGHLGDDEWFRRNGRNTADFRDPAKIAARMRFLRENRIRYLYCHLCPARGDGAIARYDDAQVERFLDAAEERGLSVIPWIGGVFEQSARIAEPQWRATFVASIETLLNKHPRIAGVQLNVEPLPSGNADFLTLLDELRPVLKGRILSVAAYPPPTRWHPHSNVHWELPYLTEVAKRSDQMAVMTYDTAIRFEKFYIKLMTQWTRELQGALSGTKCQLLLGLPAYDDADSGYHRPDVENLAAALSGILAASPAGNYAGCAIYCEWEMTPEKWGIWKSRFLGSQFQK